MGTEIITKAKEKVEQEIRSYQNMKRTGNIACIMPDEERDKLLDYLNGHIENDEGLAENILNPKKSIENGLKWAGNNLKSIFKEGMGVASDTVVFDQMLQYYFAEEKEEKTTTCNLSEEAKKKFAEQQAEREAKQKAEQEAKKASEEEAKRKKLGICEGQLDLFSFFEQQAAEEGNKSDAPAVVPTEPEEGKSGIDVFSFWDAGLTDDDRKTDFASAEEGGDYDA